MSTPTVTEIRDDELFTLKQAAGLWKISMPTVYRLMKAGLIQFVIVGEMRRIRGAEIKRVSREGAASAA
jgi:excisionase family DNA binding protein